MTGRKIKIKIISQMQAPYIYLIDTQSMEFIALNSFLGIIFRSFCHLHHRICAKNFIKPEVTPTRPEVKNSNRKLSSRRLSYLQIQLFCVY